MVCVGCGRCTKIAACKLANWKDRHAGVQEPCFFSLSAQRHTQRRLCMGQMGSAASEDAPGVRASQTAEPSSRTGCASMPCDGLRRRASLGTWPRLPRRSCVLRTRLVQTRATQPARGLWAALFGPVVGPRVVSGMMHVREWAEWGEGASQSAPPQAPGHQFCARVLCFAAAYTSPSSSRLRCTGSSYPPGLRKFPCKDPEAMECAAGGPSSLAAARLEVLSRQLTSATLNEGTVARKETDSAEEQRPAPGGGRGTLTVLDNRSGKKYTVRGGLGCPHALARAQFPALAWIACPLPLHRLRLGPS